MSTSLKQADAATIVKAWAQGRCDKCGGLVPLDNDALLVDLVRTRQIDLYFCQSRHLAPTDRCEGSPSRYQYLGEPRDTRGYDYDPSVEAEYVKAYQAVLVALAQSCQR